MRSSSSINEGKVNELVQGFDFLVGSEVGFGRGLSRGDIGTAFLPTGVSNTKQKFSAYFITGFGAISPLSPKDTVQIFLRPSDADLERLNLKGLDPKFQFIAFASPDRDSFFVSTTPASESRAITFNGMQTESMR